MILHRDARCVAVAKPAGVATHRGWADDDDALLQRVRDAVGCYVYPIHRLDRGASGITLFALDRDAARAFSDAWPGADKLTRPLLVIHGITDDNVHFAHTLALIESLYVAGKRAEVITLSATHMVPDPKLALAREQVQIDFFRQHLGEK